MAIRVAHIGTGNVGAMALRHLITDDRFELVACVVSNPEKVGKDAAALAGFDLPATGVVATDDLDALVATRPDCAVYCALAETRFFEAFGDIDRLLRAGINVVGTSPVTLMYPWGTLPDSMIDPVIATAKENGVSLFVNGVDPGFAGDVIPLALAGTCREVHQVRCLELADYGTYDGREVMVDVMGFGMRPDQTPMLLNPGVLKAAWGVTIHQLAQAFDIEITEIREQFERDWAEDSYDIAIGTIEAGTQSGLWFEVAGMAGDHQAIVVEHVTRTFEGQRPDWASPGQEGGSYRVEITGEPSYTVEICPTSADGDHNYAAILVGAGRVVNAIPAVVAAEPGLLTTLDLPLVTNPPLTTPS
ncbi:NAD(P)H-dependent amine dehydrogenase family protein [Nocardioides acrostichi]|uniref:Diacylglycerol kinase n=1 Tax=Nocardioides acrostichi TaxID=2784339 RepID=A0A930V0I6_9ACTN|nr:diacylglycerol kinase [Nocardioides acrostichi]MBF4160999.1 diacylglycerol kinase [Nocardioides acrostichi]